MKEELDPKTVADTCEGIEARQFECLGGLLHNSLPWMSYVGEWALQAHGIETTCRAARSCPACQQMGENALRTIDIHPSASIGTLCGTMFAESAVCSPIRNPKTVIGRASRLLMPLT
jgi:hypothetical protein